MKLDKVLTRKEFQELAKSNNWEVYTLEQVEKFSKDILKSINPKEKEFGAIDFVSLNRQEVINDDLTKSVMFWREAQIEWDSKDSDTLTKSRSGIYKDTPVNRKKGIVGMRYGKEKEEKKEQPKDQKEGVVSEEEKKRFVVDHLKKNAKLKDSQIEEMLKIYPIDHYYNNLGRSKIDKFFVDEDIDFYFKKDGNIDIDMMIDQFNENNEDYKLSKDKKTKKLLKDWMKENGWVKEEEK